MRLALILLLAFVGSGSTSCSRSKSKEFVDADYCFRIVPPRPDWSTLNESEAWLLDDGAVAALLGPDNVIATLRVEPEPAGGLEARIGIVRDYLASQGRKLDRAAETTRFAGLEARRLHASGRLLQVEYEWDLTAFVRQGAVYLWTVSGPAAQWKARASSFESARIALELLDGAPRMRDALVRPLCERAVGWRIEGGVYTNMLLGLRASSPPGWFVLDRATLHGLDPAASVGWRCKDPEASLLLTIEPGREAEYPGRAEEARTRYTATLEAGLDRVDPPLAVTLLGQALTLAVFEERTDVHLRVAYGTAAIAGTVFQARGWYARELDERARPAIERMLAQLQRLTADERAKLIDAEREDDPQNVVEDDFSLRRGRFESFVEGASWRKPPGLWSIELGQDIPESSAGAVFFAKELDQQLFARLTVVDVGTRELAEYHERCCTLAFGHDRSDAQPPHEIRCGDRPGLWSEGTYQSGAMPVRSRIVTAVRGGRGFCLSVWATASRFERAADLVAAAASALRVFDEPRAPIEREQDCYVNVRLGFSLRRPGSNWEAEQLPMGIWGANLGGFSWRKGSSSVFAMVAFVAEGAGDPRARAGLMTRQLAAGAAGAGEPAEDAAFQFAGCTWRHLRYEHWNQRTDLLTLVLGRTIYVLCSDGTRDGAAFEGAQRAFRWVD